jgi:hypothetical protein
MKKTTPAIIATFITGAVLSASMLMVGLDANHISVSSAALSVINNSTAQIRQTTTSNRSTFGLTSALRTGGS